MSDKIEHSSLNARPDTVKSNLLVKEKQAIVPPLRSDPNRVTLEGDLDKDRNIFKKETTDLNSAESPNLHKESHIFQTNL
jgi:hypothetical protein